MVRFCVVIRRVVALALILIVVVCGGSFVYSQSSAIDLLSEKRKAAEREIARLDSELKAIKNSSADLHKKLSILNKRLTERKAILSSIDSQITILDQSAGSSSAQAAAHLVILNLMREGYSQTVRGLYRAGQVNHYSDLLLDDSLQSLRTHREHMAIVLLRSIESRSTEIVELQGVIGNELRDIAANRSELTLLKIAEAAELTLLAAESEQIKVLERQLSAKSSEITSEKLKQQAAVEELQRQISLAIDAEMKARKRSETLSDSELDALSKSFALSRGRLPSPISGGKITDRYGVHNHATQSGVKVDNRGINLKGEGGDLVRVVSAGEVRKVFAVSGMGTSVLVRHGSYLTVYSNLRDVRVKEGESVSKGEILGVTDRSGEMHFEVWRETETQNPEDWIEF